MMKTGELVVLVDSVQEAVKFYTEKLGFDIVELRESQSDPHVLDFALVRKSKCGIVFRKPFVEEFAEFSFIKRCMSRCVGLKIELNSGIEKFFDRCQKKGVDVVLPLEQDQEKKSFSFKDPFGIKLTCIQFLEKSAMQPDYDFHGYFINKQDLEKRPESEDRLLSNMVEQVRKFGILRRSAKKYAKSKLKSLSKKIKPSS